MQTQNALPETPDQTRKRTIEVLAHASLGRLKQFFADLDEQPEFQMMRGPETGLVMIRGRMGGTGSVFNLGEATATRATVRLTTGEIGHGYRLGGDRDAVRLSAVIDALGTRDAFKPKVSRFVEETEATIKSREDKQRAETAATRVNFFTMVRGDD
ncbi:phosphonate C-P lyase system protein PhnG [Rhizobium sp. L1K21]|uniref:phosphonate C-P lyase system protein PhnG n=1 Tax=Rhizobium sp. L1K21 TaxID=2954933 RepID=UPI00209211AC|nr:phosphonate C-P lyase system protein PhnG [Rhizobium sp. L1K21]MCO6184645.1 phosphonate C-P lyase system protein PhnG [Rhizobium sp. L1K21]